MLPKVAAQDKELVRVASYRQLQAMSQQMNFLTNGRRATLDAFQTPAEVVIRPVPPGHQRFVNREAGKWRAKHYNPTTGEEYHLLPASRSRPWWLDLPLLVLQVDQGPACCGGVASLGLIILFYHSPLTFSKQHSLCFLWGSRRALKTRTKDLL